MASELGEPIKIRLELRGVTQSQADKFLKQIAGLPKHIVVEASMMHFEKDIADYQVKTAVKSLDLQQSLSKMVDPSLFEAKELVPEKIEFGTITMSLKR